MRKSNMCCLLLAIANAHLDPGHLASLEAAVNAIRREFGLAVACPNLAAKPWALRLSDEFRSGACHAGRFAQVHVLRKRQRGRRVVRNVRKVQLRRQDAAERLAGLGLQDVVRVLRLAQDGFLLTRACQVVALGEERGDP